MLSEREILDSAVRHMLPELPVLHAFSRGKDAVAVWIVLDMLKVDFVPYCLYQVHGGLPSERKYLDLIESRFGKKIERYTHPVFWEQVHNGLFSDPETPRVDVPRFDIETVEQEIALKHGFGDWQVTSGCRKADSFNRSQTIKRFEQTGWVNDRSVAYPIADLKYDELEHLIQKAGFPLPREYASVERSSDDITTAYLSGTNEDREVLEYWFPCIAAIERKFSHGS